jgi:hypothetical protein
MRVILKWLVVILTGFALTSCKNSDSPTPGGPRPGTPTQPAPGEGVDCRSFADFLPMFSAMKEFSQELNDQADTGNRLALASAHFAEYLRYSYGEDAELRSNNRETQELYLKYFKWVFTSDGLVRQRPGHPQANACMRRD